MRSRVFVGVVWAAAACATAIPACQVDTGTAPSACEGATCHGGAEASEASSPGTTERDSAVALDGAKDASVASDSSTGDAADATALEDADPADADSMDASVADTGGADAALGCVGVPVIDPSSWGLPAPPQVVTLPTGSFGCGWTANAKVFRFTRQVHFTMGDTHGLSSPGGAAMQLRSGCDMGSTVLASGGRGYYDYRVLEPGLYTFVQCRNLGGFFAEPTPAPANTNTSCATAVPLARPSAVPRDSPQPNTGVRMYDPGEIRYYTFNSAFGPPNGPGIDRIMVESTGEAALNNGRVRFTIRSACADPGTVVYTSNWTTLWTNGPAITDLRDLPRNRPLWLVLTDVTPGLMLTIRHQTLF